MTGTRSRKTERRATWLLYVIIPLVIGLMLIIGTAGPVLFQRRELIKQLDDDEDLTDMDRAGRAFTSSYESYMASHEERLSISDLERVTTSLDEVSPMVQLAKAQQAVVQSEISARNWAELYTSTLTDDVGKRLGNDDNLLADFIALQTFKKPDSEFSDLRARIDTVLETDKTTDEFLEFSNIQQDAFNWYRHYERRLRLLRELRTEAESVELGTTTLEAAIDSYHELILTNRTLAVEKAKLKAADRMQAALADLKSTTVSMSQSVADLQHKLTTIDQGNVQTNREPAMLDTNLASRSDYERELPRLKTLLKPFVTAGYAQPTNGEAMTYIANKTPMSYSALRRVGAFAETQEGLEILARIGGSKSDGLSNDRPLGSFPVFGLESPLEDARIAEAQRLLRVYGLLMIEDRLLAP